MNVLGMVFSILLIVLYSFYACWEKQIGDDRLASHYRDHQKANRKISQKFENERYKSFGGIPETSPRTKQKKPSASSPKLRVIPDSSEACAKINLLPLLEEGREKQPVLYELVAKMLRTFYGASLFNHEKHFEYEFLDALISAQKELELEKVVFKDQRMQKIYYKMLKGTSEDFPSVLDLIKLEKEKKTLCLFHAHPNLIALFFGSKVASRLYNEMHKKDAPLMTYEIIERICSECHATAPNKELIDLLDLQSRRHSKSNKTLSAKEGEISLRKNIYL